MKQAWRWLAVFVLAAALLGSLALAEKPDDLLHVAFLDVGQGDAILISKGSQQVLVDGGPSPQAIGLALGREMPFWDRTIELVVLTHEHADHVTGLVEVLKDYEVGRVLTPAFASDLPVCDEWRRLIQEKGIPCTPACAGETIRLGDVSIDVLNPPEQPLTGTESDIDNASVVLYVRDGDISFLLCGDLGREGELWMLEQRLVPQATVLKAGHHGSATSDSTDFLVVVRPRAAVISVGADNDYGLPDEATLARLEQAAGTGSVFRTDQRGTIEFTTDGQSLWVSTDR